MNRKLAVVAFAFFTVSAVAQAPSVQIPISTTIQGPSPWIDVRAYGAVGDGMHDDYTAINNAILACPPNGCTIYFPSSATYKIGTGLTITHSQVGVKLVGECGGSGHSNTSTETCSRISSGQSGIVILTVGDGTQFQSGLVIQDLGFQDTGGGVVAGAIHLERVQDFTLINVHCRDITTGYCMQFDGTDTGSTDFTQFGVVINPTAINVLYPIQTNYQASEINLYGGNLDCNGLGSSIGMDLGFTNHVKVGVGSYDTGGEWGVFGTHILGCVTGISMFNNSNMNYYGAIEQSGGGPGVAGIVIDGDRPGSASKSIISGSIGNVNKGVLLDGQTTDTRILANIDASAPIVIGGSAISATLPTTLILTTANYAGSGGTAIGTQVPTDVTMPGEAKPPVPVTGSRRFYVDSGNGNDLTVERSDGSVTDLESTLLNYQPPNGTSITGTNQTVYTFSVPYIPPGKGIRARVFWQCTSCSAATKTFTWQFGTATSAYSGYTSSGPNLSYTEVRIFNDAGSQTNNTMMTDAITVGTNLTDHGNVLTMTQNTGAANSLTFIVTTGVDVIQPKGFIVEAI